jgi:hypothetical protein
VFWEEFHRLLSFDETRTAKKHERIERGYIDIQTHSKTHRRQGDLISLLFFLLNKEIVLKRKAITGKRREENTQKNIKEIKKHAVNKHSQ